MLEEKDNSIRDARNLQNKLEHELREKENQRVLVIKQLEINYTKEIQRYMVEINNINEINNQYEE